MKKLPLIALLLPFSTLAQPLNTLNNPNLPGYQNPSQQRMQTRMKMQQNQQQGRLNQQLQRQSRLQQQQLKSQLNSSTERLLAPPPGEAPSGSHTGAPPRNSAGAAPLTPTR